MPLPEAGDQDLQIPSTQEAQEPALARRQDPELVAVPMTEQQQDLFGWLGLNPALLLDPSPQADNVLVRVVRPGEDEQAVLEEARQQLAESAGRRRRRGGRNVRGGARSTATAVPLPATSATQADGADATEAEAAPLTVEITPLETESVETKAVGTVSAETASTVNPASVEASVDPGNPEEDVEEPRRRRRRSSASQAD